MASNQKSGLSQTERNLVHMAAKRSRKVDPSSPLSQARIRELEEQQVAKRKKRADHEAAQERLRTVRRQVRNLKPESGGVPVEIIGQMDIGSDDRSRYLSKDGGYDQDVETYPYDPDVLKGADRTRIAGNVLRESFAMYLDAQYYEALRKLKSEHPKLALVVHLRYNHYLSVREVGKRLGYPKSTIARWESQAMALMRAWCRG